MRTLIAPINEQQIGQSMMFDQGLSRLLPLIEKSASGFSSLKGMMGIGAASAISLGLTFFVVMNFAEILRFLQNMRKRKKPPQAQPRSAQDDIDSKVSSDGDKASLSRVVDEAICRTKVLIKDNQECLAQWEKKLAEFDLQCEQDRHKQWKELEEQQKIMKEQSELARLNFRVDVQRLTRNLVHRGELQQRSRSPQRNRSAPGAQ